MENFKKKDKWWNKIKFYSFKKLSLENAFRYSKYKDGLSHDSEHSKIIINRNCFVKRRKCWDNTQIRTF